MLQGVPSLTISSNLLLQLPNFSELILIVGDKGEQIREHIDETHYRSTNKVSLAKRTEGPWTGYFVG